MYLAAEPPSDGPTDPLVEQETSPRARLLTMKRCTPAEARSRCRIRGRVAGFAALDFLIPAIQGRVSSATRESGKGGVMSHMAHRLAPCRLPGVRTVSVVPAFRRIVPRSRRAALPLRAALCLHRSDEAQSKPTGSLRDGGQFDGLGGVQQVEHGRRPGRPSTRNARGTGSSGNADDRGRGRSAERPRRHARPDRNRAPTCPAGGNTRACPEYRRRMGRWFVAVRARQVRLDEGPLGTSARGAVRAGALGASEWPLGTPPWSLDRRSTGGTARWTTSSRATPRRITSPGAPIRASLIYQRRSPRD